MGRAPRLWAPDTVYHVICRGNNRQDIFIDNQDYYRYLDIWRRVKTKIDFEIYAYVLMTNHVHWLLKTGDQPLSDILHRSHSIYARWFNEKHKRVGHLFQSRYKAIVCSEDNYLLALARYIHLNPVRAGLVKNPHQYIWSSYHSYCGREDGLVQTSFLLNYFSRDLPTAYREFVRFSMNTYRRVNPNADREQDPFQTIYLDPLVTQTSMVTGVPVEDIRSNTKKSKTVSARHLFTKVAVLKLGAKRSQIAQYLGVNRSQITRWVNSSLSAEAQSWLQKLQQLQQSSREKQRYPE